MNTLVILLRLVHVVSGVFWLGSSMLTTFFISPAVKATGDAGQQLMGYLVNKARLSVRITAAAILTVLAGGGLYWIDSQGLTSSWQTSGPGVGFGLGGLFALAGFGSGLLVGRYAGQLGKLGAQAKGKPSADLLARMQGLQRQMTAVGHISTGFLMLALVCMATARYWAF